MILRPMLLAGVTAALLSTAAAAADITLYNTGVDANGVVRANAAAETHYVLDYGPVRVATSAESSLPFGPGLWLGDNSLSAWIGPVGALPLVAPAGVYSYRTTFSLDGLDHLTAQISGQWATDNRGLDILLNGVSTGQTTAMSPFGGYDFGFQAFSAFSLTSGFVAGVNTIDFVVRNLDDPSLTGLRVEMTGTADTLVSPVPEPAVWGMMILGFGAVGASMRRRGAKTSLSFA